jgi:hypothetical protein
MSCRPRIVEVILATAVLLLLTTRPLQLGAQVDKPSNVGLIDRVQALETKLDRMSQDFGIGTVIFCLNDQAPGKHWAPCDGESVFSGESNVPEHLRGKKVPK